MTLGQSGCGLVRFCADCVAVKALFFCFAGCLILLWHVVKK